MPPLLSSGVVAFIFWIATSLSVLAFVQEKDYIAVSLLPGVIGLAILYTLVDGMAIEVARAWVRWAISSLGVQIIILLFWRYFSLKSRHHHG